MHLNGGATNCVGNYICNEGKRVHLYGGAAAMLDDVMQVQWEVEVYCARVIVAFAWPPAFALS